MPTLPLALPGLTLADKQALNRELLAEMLPRFGISVRTAKDGVFALKALEGSFVTARQIESARRAMTRSINRGGKIWIRIFPDKPVTKKAAEVPMGKGKGDPVGFVAEIKPGRILFEIDGVDDKVALEALRKAGTKISAYGISFAYATICGPSPKPHED